MNKIRNLIYIYNVIILLFYFIIINYETTINIIQCNVFFFYDVMKFALGVSRCFVVPHICSLNVYIYIYIIVYMKYHMLTQRFVFFPLRFIVCSERSHSLTKLWESVRMHDLINISMCYLNAFSNLFRVLGPKMATLEFCLQ